MEQWQKTCVVKSMIYERRKEWAEQCNMKNEWAFHYKGLPSCFQTHCCLQNPVGILKVVCWQQTAMSDAYTFS